MTEFFRRCVGAFFTFAVGLLVCVVHPYYLQELLMQEISSPSPATHRADTSSDMESSFDIEPTPAVTSLRVGGLPEFLGEDLEGTPCPEEPAPSILHVVYALQATTPEQQPEQLERLTQSVWSLYSVGCRGAGSCRRRLLVHVFFEGVDIALMERALAASVFRGLNVRLHPVCFDDVVSRERSVWGHGNRRGPFLARLSTSVSFFRHYIAGILHSQYEAASFLYLDTDALCIGAGLADLFKPPLPLVSFGVQSEHPCDAGDTLLLHGDLLAGLGLSSQGLCLVGAVMLVNVTLWLQQNVAADVENLLVSKATSKMRHLGSMPPLMDVLRGKWKPLIAGNSVVDGQGSTCAVADRPSGSFLFPFKAQCPGLAPKPLQICMLGGAKVDSQAGSQRLMAMQMGAFAQLLGVSVKRKYSESCAVVTNMGAPPKGVDPRRVAVVVFKPDDTEGARAPESESWWVADGIYVDQLFEAQGRHKRLRMHEIEDMRPNASLRHQPRVGDLRNDSSALVCYHGNAMHVISLLHVLPRQQHFKLRAVIPASGIAKVSEVLRESAQSLIEQERVELIGYTPEDIYLHLKDCDIGLAPSEVQRKGDVSVGKLAQGSDKYFEPGDTFPEDIVRRCKRTENGGRMFVFMQLGIPSIIDSCPDSIRFARYKAGPTAIIVNHVARWREAIMRLLADARLRRKLSDAARSFAEEHLTTRMLAGVMLDKMSCYTRQQVANISESNY